MIDMISQENNITNMDSALIQMLMILKDSHYDTRKRIIRSLKTLLVLCLDRLYNWNKENDDEKYLLNRITDSKIISDFIYYYQDARCPSVQKKILKVHDEYYTKEKISIRNYFNDFSEKMNHAIQGGHIQRILYVFEDSYNYLKKSLDILFTKDPRLIKVAQYWKSLVEVVSASSIDMDSAEKIKHEIDTLTSKILDKPKLEFHTRGDLYRVITKEVKEKPDLLEIFIDRRMNVIRDYCSYITSKKLGFNIDTFKRFAGWVKRQNK
jgi:hypothetical protein